jgi:hypothetical protein
MIGPTWLAAILGAVMLVAAVASLTRIIVAWRARRATDFEIDGHNVLMGVSMAGMLIPSLFIATVGPSTVVWITVWILVTIWFGISVARDASRHEGGRRFTGHHLPHFVMSGAMVYMFAVMNSGGGSASGAGDGMGGMAAGGALVPLATLDYVFVIFMLGYAVLVLDRLPVLAVVGTGDLQQVRSAARPESVKPLAPRLAAATNIAMALTMGYMLTMMFV